MKKIEIGDVLRVEHKSMKISDSIDFWQEVQKIIQDGYVFKIPESPRQAPKFFPYVRVDFIKPEDIVIPEPPKKEVKLLEDLNELSGKEELLRFAEENKIDVPKEKVNPSAIKKFLKGFLTDA